MALIRRASLVYPRQWNPTQVPTFSTEVDTTHPLSVGLAGLWIPNGLDLSGNGNNGTPTAASTGPVPSLSAGYFGPNLNVSGGQRIAIPNAPAINISGPSISLGGWILPTSVAQYQCIISKTAGNGSARQYTLQTGGSWSSQVYVELKGPGVYAPSISTPPIVNNWNHIFATYSAITGQIVVYFNGNQVGSETATSANIVADATNVTLGSEFGSWLSALSGGLGGVHLYNTTLTPALVKWLASESFVMLRPIVRRQYYVPAGGGTAYNGLWLASSFVSGASLSAVQRRGVVATFDNSGMVSRGAAGRAGASVGANVTAASTSGRTSRIGKAVAASLTAASALGAKATAGFAMMSSASITAMSALGKVGRKGQATSSSLTSAIASGKVARAGVVMVASTTTGVARGGVARIGAWVSAAISAFISIISSKPPFGPPPASRTVIAPAISRVTKV